MGNPGRTQLISDAEYQAALARGKAAMASPYAIHARFEPRRHRLAIDYSNGLSIAFDVRKNGTLAPHAAADLAEPYVTPGGDDLLFERASLSFACPVWWLPRCLPTWRAEK